ncbi:hypothetical protein [Bacillus sp. FJAT-28004]|uniref:hypothetical protein n=1 Tax=Bacillus sp. FJAT-28004 TaxID=1679165 RepID=UPI0006B4FE8A|nr:hypothetical protein [Bacillus sp. FJAT-28004]
MTKENNVSREAFEKQFKQVNASWGYEDAGIDDKGKELIYKRLNGEITEEEFNLAVKKLAE